MLRRDERLAAGDAATLARIMSAVMFLSTAASVNIDLSVEKIVQDIRGVGAGNYVTSRDLGILADQAAEPISPKNRTFALGAGECRRPAGGLCCSVRCGLCVS